VDEFFENHRDSKYVVIDLRRNTGGNGAWGYYLLDHLTDSPYRIKQRFSIKVSDLFRESRYRDKAGRNLADAKNGAYIEAVEKTTRNRTVRGGPYPGKVFLLISARTFSAGVVTAAIFKYNKMGAVIGRETSGKETFCSDPVMHQLPNTGLVVSIPVAVYALPGDNPDRGVVPDVEVEHTIDGLCHSEDMELEEVRKIIQAQEP
jgi:C-terminal processing protease CtpA/Prc